MSALDRSQVHAVVMVDSNWRSRTLSVSSPTDPAGRHLAEALRSELAERDFWPGPADPAWEVTARQHFAGWRHGAPAALVAVGVPPHTPDRAMAVGEAIAAACATVPGSTALLVTGAITAAHELESEGPLGFQQTLRRLLEQAAGPEILNVGAELWIGGRPEAELGHLFVLMGAAPSRSATYLAEWQAAGSGYAVISFGEASSLPPLAPSASPTVFRLTLKGESPSA
ncbi:MAG: class III extradiol ring-cleavage dioxygenase family protein [Sulfobacillus sp.]